MLICLRLLSLENKLTSDTFKVIAAKAAAQLDRELMSTGGFSIDQLMELAGLSVAQAVYKTYPPSKYPKVLILVGPGNNGGDGLVAARHLQLFGYIPKVFYPIKTKGDLFKRLETQLRNFGIEFIDKFDDEEVLKTNSIIDALFGFSFHPPIRPPFDKVIDVLENNSIKSDEEKTPVISVDIPSSWDVDDGPNKTASKFHPEVLVSLTAPKPAAKFFKGRHFVGGRFVWKDLAEKWNVEVPSYEGVDQVVEITN